MNDKKILWISEASYLNTGYAKYSKEIISRLHARGYKIAEFACYANSSDVEWRETPWPVYCNNPDSASEEAKFKSDPINQFGAWKFEHVALDWQPTHICTLRDWWMDEFVTHSPYRKFYNHIWMPVVDCELQMEQWLDNYGSADCVLTYTDWSKRVLERETNNKIKVLSRAAPSAGPAFMQHNRDAIKKTFNLQGKNIVGMVARNQSRKLIPDLFEAFSIFLRNSQRNDTYLYLHTSYPDNSGWDIPKFLVHFGITSKVLFTYLCRECKTVFPNHFSDALTTCIQCGNQSATLPTVKNGIDDSLLAQIMSAFDLYIQYHNSGAFEMPLIEAAACGVPVMAVDYAGPVDILDYCNGIRVPVKGYTYEAATSGCKRAVPNNEKTAELLEEFFSLPKQLRVAKGMRTAELAKKYFNWDKAADKWEQAIQLCENKQPWNSPADITQPSPQINHTSMSNRQYARWLIDEVLCDPSYHNTYLELRTIRDLNYGVTVGGLGGKYYNEMSFIFDKIKFEEFNRDTAYKHFVSLRLHKNFWEEHRIRKSD